MKRLLLLVATLAATGCVTGSDLERLEDQIAELQEQVSSLERQASSKEEVQRLNETLAKQTQTLLKSNADLSVRVNDMGDKLENVQGTVEQTNYRVDRLAQQVTQNQRDVADLKNAVRAPAPNEIRDEVVVQPPPAGGADPVATYQSAYRDYQRGNYDLAIQGFREFLKENQDSDLADNAAYWIGESLFSQKKYREAIGQFDRVINQFSESDKVPASLLKKGYAYIEVGEKAQGVVQLQYVVHEHPQSPEASLARQRLKALGIQPR